MSGSFSCCPGMRQRCQTIHVFTRILIPLGFRHSVTEQSLLLAAQDARAARLPYPMTFVSAASMASVIRSMSLSVAISAGERQSVLFSPGRLRLVAPMMTP